MVVVLVVSAVCGVVRGVCGRFYPSHCEMSGEMGAKLVENTVHIQLHPVPTRFRYKVSIPLIWLDLLSSAGEESISSLFQPC